MPETDAFSLAWQPETRWGHTPAPPASPLSARHKSKRHERKRWSELPIPEGHVAPTTGNRGKMADLTVAKTMLEQLGGEHFVAMTGAKNFVGTEDSLTFEVGRNPKHVSHVRVTQTPDDLYAVTFFRRGKAPQIMDGICCDILQELFTNNTGLYISLLASA